MAQACLAGLSSTALPGDERGGGHAAEDREREIPRGDDGAEAAALVGEGVVFAGEMALRSRAEFDERLAGVVAAEIDGLGDVGIGFAPGLGLLVDFHRGEAEAVLFEPRAEIVDAGGAGFQGEIAPGGPCLDGNRDGLFDIIGSWRRWRRWRCAS